MGYEVALLLVSQPASHPASQPATSLPPTLNFFWVQFFQQPLIGFFSNFRPKLNGPNQNKKNRKIATSCDSY
jgi:hypothetical protein